MLYIIILILKNSNLYFLFINIKKNDLLTNLFIKTIINILENFLFCFQYILSLLLVTLRNEKLFIFSYFKNSPVLIIKAVRVLV